MKCDKLRVYRNRANHVWQLETNCKRLELCCIFENYVMESSEPVDEGPLHGMYYFRVLLISFYLRYFITVTPHFHIFARCFAPTFTLLKVVSVLFQVELENKRMHGHFAAVFGFTCGLLELSLVQTQQLFLFSTLRTVIASAVRLGNIGPLQVTDVISYEVASSSCIPVELQ